jgi:hypothetical protein
MSMLTLWKSGAEKIIRLLGLTAHFPNLHQYELCCVHKQEIQMIVLKCELRASNGTVVAEGTGARYIIQDGWNLNKAMKMAEKSAVIDATIRVAGLTGVFIKTHRRTANKFPHRVNHPDNRPVRKDCKAITARQKQFIQQLAGRKGMTTENLGHRLQDLFNKNLDDLDRVQASRFIQNLIKGD